VGVFIAVFDSEDTADQAMKAIEDLERRGLMLDIYDHAKVVRDADGKIHVHSGRSLGKSTGAGLGVGALLGLVFPPAFIATTVVGAAGGAVWSKLKKETFDKPYLKDAAEEMLPGRTAIAVITEGQHMETLKETVPSAVRTASHVFPELNEESVREWVGSLAPAARAEEAAATQGAPADGAEGTAQPSQS
jgi:uncharacterized membrane protein